MDIIVSWLDATDKISSSIWYYDDLICYIIRLYVICYLNFNVNSIFLADDIFGIDEITLYEGEHSEKVYSVAGEIVDGVSIIFKGVSYYPVTISIQYDNYLV